MIFMGSLSEFYLELPRHLVQLVKSILGVQGVNVNFIYLIGMTPLMHAAAGTADNEWAVGYLMAPYPPACISTAEKLVSYLLDSAPANCFTPAHLPYLSVHLGIPHFPQSALCTLRGADTF